MHSAHIQHLDHRLHVTLQRCATDTVRVTDDVALWVCKAHKPGRYRVSGPLKDEHRACGEGAVAIRTRYEILHLASLGRRQIYKHSIRDGDAQRVAITALRRIVRGDDHGEFVIVREQVGEVDDGARIMQPGGGGQTDRVRALHARAHPAEGTVAGGAGCTAIVEWRRAVGEQDACVITKAVGSVADCTARVAHQKGKRSKGNRVGPESTRRLD